jgi:UDPglucose 6-dehydrogenase
MDVKKIVVAGMWHLGCVTAACLADKAYQVVGFDTSEEVVKNLNHLILPIYEPGLDALMNASLNRGNLTFSSDINTFENADIVWIAFDTPVNEHDEADTDYVIQFIQSIFKVVKPGAIFVISSQLPVGSIKFLDETFRKNYPQKNLDFVSMPENLRLGKAIEIFQSPERIIVGLDNPLIKDSLENILLEFSSNIIWMSVASAEMTKHAINSFLALSVTFINEIATICELTGADAGEVEKGLKSEQRIGPKAYLKPGMAFAGGTLARDIAYLSKISSSHGFEACLLNAVKQSNDLHKTWLKERINSIVGNLKGKKIGVLGLTYKPGTNTLRRSSAVEICQWLVQQGVRVEVYDPAIKKLPEGFNLDIRIHEAPLSLLQNLDALVVATECPEFNEIDYSCLSFDDSQCAVFDGNRYLNKHFENNPKFKYFSVGRAL